MDPEEYDRISELPNSLILSILSLLKTRDAITTTFLSKRWQNLWTTVPCLHFHGEKRDFIHAALAHWRGPKVTKFTMKYLRSDDDDYYYTCPTSESDVHSWLYFAIATQSEVLDMDLGNWWSVTHREGEGDGDGHYTPPQLLYSCSSLKKLTLISLNLKIEGNVQWSRLKSLSFFSRKPLSEETLKKILSGAPLLEDLDFCVYEISENFSIRSRTLKKLNIGRLGSSAQPAVEAALSIWAPNLLKLEISCFFNGCCCLDVPSLIHAGFDNSYIVDSGLASARYEMFYQLFRSISHVEKIGLSDSLIKLLVEMKKKGMVVQFSKAAFLNFSHCVGYKLVDVVEICPKLMAMSIFNLESRDASSSSLPSEMTFPNPSLLQLKRVEIIILREVDADASIFLDIQILLANAPMLEKMVFRIWCCKAYPSLCVLIEEKVTSMPRASPTAEVIYDQGS